MSDSSGDEFKGRKLFRSLSAKSPAKTKQTIATTSRRSQAKSVELQISNASPEDIEETR
jgi:hypothetical protein